MRVLGLSLAAAFAAALLVLPATEASAQPFCAAKPSKPKKCVDWVCGTNGPCVVKEGLFSAVGCVKWKCNAVARKR